MNLIPVINLLKEQLRTLEHEREVKIKEIEEEYNKKISDINTAIKVNSEMNTACNICQGTGKMEVDDGLGYESRLHRVTCTNCNGKGIKPVK